MQPIQIIVVLFALFVVTRIILRLRDNKLTINEFFMWMFVWCSIIIIALVPSISSIFADLSGIGRGVDFLIYLSLILLFYIMFKLIVKVETLQSEITTLVRELSLKGIKKKK